MTNQAAQAIKDAKAQAGAGWAMLGPELQKALVCQKLVSLTLGQYIDDPDAKENKKLAAIQNIMSEALVALDPAE